MTDQYPDAPPSRGWPVGLHARIETLEADRNRLPRMVFAATLLGTSLPHYLKPEVLEQAKALAAQYPGGAVLVAALVLLGGAKIPPPAPGSPLMFLMPVWTIWARYVAQTPWDRWGGFLKGFGQIVPALPAAPDAPPSKPPPTLRTRDLPPAGDGTETPRP